MKKFIRANKIKIPSKKELENELKVALEEIGKIKPWFDEDVNAWVFEHPLYPVRYAGKSSKEVIKNYPKYLEVFIEHRMQDRIGEINERKTKGKGGYRPGSGRPKGAYKAPTKQIRVPIEIAIWLKTPGVICHIQEMLKAYDHVTEFIHKKKLTF